MLCIMKVLELFCGGKSITKYYKNKNNNNNNNNNNII